MIIIALTISILILAVGTWLGTKLFSKDPPFLLCLATAAITALVSLIPGIGFVAGTVAFLVCLVALVQLDFWPEAVIVWFVVRLINFGVGLALVGLLRG